jgi:hypothetical protein
MGSFSYSCQLSGLPITSGVKCAIVMMLPNGENYYDNSEKHYRKYGSSHFCSNDGPNVFFNEYAFPIFGTYNDYGGIEDIIKDDNTECLEEHFGLSIEDICTVLCDNRKDEYYKENNRYCESAKILDKDNSLHMLLLKTSAIWLQGDFYKKLSTKFGGEDNKLDIGVNGILTKLGFNFIGKNKEKERYNLEYEKDGLKIYTDGNWINIPKESIYDLKALKRWCNKQGVVIDITTLNSMGYHEQVYECILPELENLARGDRWNTERVIHLLLGNKSDIQRHFSDFDFEIYVLSNRIKALEKGESEEEDDAVTKLINAISQSKSESEEKTLDQLKIELEELTNLKKKENKPKKHLAELYFSKIKEKEGFLKTNIVEWHSVKSFFFPLGKYLYPIGTSPQCGDREAVQTFLETALSTLKEEIAYYKEKYGDDDIEDEDEDQ